MQNLSLIIQDIKTNFMTQARYNSNEAVFACQFLIGMSMYLFTKKIESDVSIVMCAFP